MDLTRDIIFRGVTLNDEGIVAHSDLTPGVGKGITGSVVDSAQMSDVDVTQYLEKRSQGDGMDAGDPFLGVRRIRMSGTLYDVSRPLVYDRLRSMRAAINPVLAGREEPGDRGYRPLYFSWPTADSDNFPDGQIDLFVKAMPRQFDQMFSRETLGGDDVDALAIPWQATFVCKDPGIYGASPVDMQMTDQGSVVTGATAAAATNLISKTTHGLVAGDRVRFTTLTGGTGLNTTTTYYVIASGLTSGAFKVSTTSNGTEVDITVNYTVVQYIKSITTSGTYANRGNYLATVNALFEVGPYSGVIAMTIGDTNLSITVPASTGTRIIRFNGTDKYLTVEEDDDENPRMDLLTFNNETTWPFIDPGDGAFSVTSHGCDMTSNSHVWFYEQYA